MESIGFLSMGVVSLYGEKHNGLQTGTFREMSRLRCKYWCSAFLILLLVTPRSTIPSSVTASVEDLIEYRQSAYRMIQYHFDQMAIIVSDEIDWDSDHFLRNAYALSVLSELSAAGFSMPSSRGTTRALPEIWEKPDEFNALMQDYLQAASRLAAIANGGTVPQRKAQFQKLEATCLVCHERYRSEDELYQ